MSSYYRVKKSRELREARQGGGARGYKRIYRENDTPINVNSNESGNNIDNAEQENVANISDNEYALLQEEIICNGGINDKILQWTLKNLDTLRLNVITELLQILREEGHTSLPKSAQALLGTKHHRILQVMISNRETEGAYIYLGIRQGLEKIISPDIYRDNKVSILIHIDGMQVFNNSQIQVWPILVKLSHNKYVSKPFVVALYCGDSKPQSSNIFLNDFVQEAKNLISNGVELNGGKYSFEISGIIADAPARAFLKYCKPPNSFYACERCTTKGVSVGRKGAKKRVYPEINGKKRSKDSFINREQLEHHKDDIYTILLELPNFNIIDSVVIDSMHLLYLGVMKALLEKWITRKSVAGLKKRKVQFLKDVMISLSKDVPCEFQRKKFDLNALARWKATQYRFFLLYCGSTVLRDVLSNNFYRHFLLLFVACRLLNKHDVSSSYCDFANQLLRKFFYLLPSFYGELSQTLNMHYLIHIADDVKTFKMPLSELSAFWGESYIGTFKKLVKSPKKPLTQIINRLSELESQKKCRLREKRYLDKCVFESCNIFLYNEEEYRILRSIKVNNFVLKSTHPDNIVQLSDDTIFKIESILLKIRDTEDRVRLQDLYILGYKLDDPRETFNYPISSNKVGIFVGNKFLSCKEIFALKDVKYKCMLLNINGNHYAISLLHTFNTSDL